LLGSTFTEQARRAQIVSAATTAIAEAGYRNASFAQIAKRAGLSSTGLISYHFASKADLIGEVVTTVLADLGAFMAVRMETAGDAATALRAYIEGTIDFIDTHREPMTALTEVGMLADAAARVVMFYTLPISVVPGLGGALWPVTFVVLQIVTNVYCYFAGLNALLGARWRAHS
jgi:AcrR family transcriptional regulator